MDFSGRYEIPARPDTVWAGLNDPDTLKACIPGCEEITKVSPTDFQATATLKIGPVKARFKGKVALTELDPPHRCVLSGQGQGGMAGFAKGNATIVLEPDATGTVLTYTARATVGGKLAQIGQRLIDGAAKQIADDFFGRFATRLSASGAETAAAAAAAAGTAEARVTPAGQPQPGETATPIREGLSAEIWVVGLIAVVAILLLLFSVSL
jgi:carbon monoxide dehydrogenase subunit G